MVNERDVKEMYERLKIKPRKKIGLQRLTSEKPLQKGERVVYERCF